MTIYRVDVSLVAAHRIGAHILPPDGKNLCDDEDAEGFWFSPSLDGARALNDAEVSVLQRSRIELMQRPVRPLHCAGIHHNLMIVSTAFLPGFAAFLLYPVTLHRRRRGLTAAVELEILIILAACFTLWMGFVLAAM